LLLPFRFVQQKRIRGASILMQQACPHFRVMAISLLALVLTDAACSAVSCASNSRLDHMRNRGASSDWFGAHRTACVKS
jgi:hypothetical protein